MTIAFFDTETHKDWVCQLAVLITDDLGNEINTFSSLIHSDGRELCMKYCYPVHGISREKSDTYGIHYSSALDIAGELLSLADTIVAHNFSFDERFLRMTAYDCGPDTLAQVVELFKSRNCICTMQESKSFCGLKNVKGQPKPPKLTELYSILFDEEFDGHDALKDTRATARCFFELRKLGIL
jgi:DNA polymerase III epsilon subunit-like protein